MAKDIIKLIYDLGQEIAKDPKKQQTIAFLENQAFKLKKEPAFLEAADLVKFAGRTATVETAAAAAERARDCIEGDDSAAAAREAAK